MNIVCIGDSLTFGYGVRHNANWCSKLENLSSLNIINKGINGDTSIGILSRFYKDVVSDNTTICIIMCGTNDLLMNRSTNSIIDNINLMIKDCLTNNIIPLLISPPPICGELAMKLWSNDINYDIVNSNLEKLNEELINYCKINNINFIDLYRLLPREKKYYTDGLHLNEEGNSFLYKLVRDKIAL